MKDLSTLLHESAAHPPADQGAASDLAELVRRGQSRVRRRRAVAAGGVVASVAALAVAGTLVSGGLGGPTAPEPARQLAPVGPVVEPGDAVPGVAGRDHTVVTTYTNENLDRANGQYLSGTTPDGLVLVKDGPHGIDNESRWGLLDPGTGRTDWLPEAPAVLENPVVLDRDRLVFAGYRDRQAAVVSYDRATGGWLAPVMVPGKAWGLVQARPGPGGRLYFSVEVGQSGTQAALWSVAVDEPAGIPRDEGLTVGDWDIAGDRLAYTATHNEPNDRVTVRDLVTGDQHSFDPESGDACNQLSMQAAGDHLVLGQYCGTTNGGESPVRDDRVQVIDLEGNPVVTIQGNGVEPGTVSADGFVVNGYGTYGDRDGAVYTWSFAEGKLRRVADSASRFSMSWVTSDALMWADAVNDGHGARQVVATLD